MDTKRAYKLQEFVAHASDVNCVKVGRTTSRILITGGEDQKVNVSAIGKPSAVLSLSGLTSPVESVSFDSSEVMIGAGASSGTIKIWAVEEAKALRTFTGHRSSCASLDSHPFGEFFASGSSDTNMKIWDMRKKGCIHTYKGHTRRIDVLRFTPDGRWIVSGGSDYSVKIWDLTAGKLLHDFRMHECPINCLDFHPHEFLLATGSGDKAVKFWDLQTFELIGSSGPENSREYFEPTGPSNFSASYERSQYASALNNSRRPSSVAREQSASAGDEDYIADLTENNQEFIHAVKSRLTKLEVVYRCWQNNDVKGCIDATQRMQDLAVIADIISVLMENTSSITLDICTCVLPLASSVLESSYDWHLKVALEIILKLAKSFGTTISSTLSFTPVGVDIEAEQRFQRCNLCFQELIKVHSVLFTLARRQGEVGRSAQELSLFLQDIFQQSSR